MDGASRDTPREDLDRKPSGDHGRVLRPQLSRPFRADVENREATVLRVVERAAREQIAGLVEVGEVRHVRVLEGFGCLLVELRRIGPQHRQHDRELVEFHGSS